MVVGEGELVMAEDRAIPYVLAGREILDRPAPDGLEVHPASCIFCGRVVRHVNDGGNGWILNAVTDGVARRYMYCMEGPCAEASAPWIWKCGCESDYIENVGDRCGGCGRHRRLARWYDRAKCPFCSTYYEVYDRHGIGRHDACPDCAKPIYKPVPYEIPPITVDTTPGALCQALLDAAEEHGLATEGAEMAWGDVEDFFRAAFDLLTPEQRDSFWRDERVGRIVERTPEYDAVAEAVYGPFEEESDE
jgi:hypothetical protein